VRAEIKAYRSQSPGFQTALTWSRLMGAAALVEAALLLITGVSLGDAETLTFGLVVSVTTAWFLWRRGVVPILVRSLVFLDVLFFMATATIANLSTHETIGAVALPLALGATSATGLIATAGYLVGDPDPGAGQKAPVLVVAAALVLSAVGIAFSLAGAGTAQQAAGSDLKISVHSARYSTTSLSATHGQVAIDATNNDLFWHTVTIDKLGVDVRVPVKGHRRIVFPAPPGTYIYYCAIPGHASIGMKGTLTVH
jgi:plastocyanin